MFVKKEFPAPSKLTRHEKVHEPSNSDNRENVDSYPCDKCDKTYTQKRYMIKHIPLSEQLQLLFCKHMPHEIHLW